MEVIIKEYAVYKEAEILGLYTSVGWTNYTDNPEMLRNAYLNSLNIYGAYVDDKLIGIIRVVGDGYSVIFIQDLLVHPEFQRKGVGTLLLKKVLCEYDSVYQKHLMTEDTEKTILFYKSLGFVDNSEIGCKAFSVYKVMTF
ncbi:GNAT family N-acetyltransferase [Catonella massiliensis]|uniref:GNAT family N-acetyltransferase n=1 Tax=Catonella massiliensis TaxID=2799636 RepID=A0ABS1J1J4_9FIRM|nr:GNAT family N-acetyltransferase [Catonella massiliensis]MBK5897398.1 GNAT family N-acetyltransferase [Catonella massiliensis]